MRTVNYGMYSTRDVARKEIGAKENEGYFHGWGLKHGTTCAIVQTAAGDIVLLDIEQIRFDPESSD